jgi:hypothetical protein
MLLNKFYLSVQGRLFRVETFCLFSFKGVISIYISIGKYKPVYHGGHLLPCGYAHGTQMHIRVSDNLVHPQGIRVL